MAYRIQTGVAAGGRRQRNGGNTVQLCCLDVLKGVQGKWRRAMSMLNMANNSAGSTLIVNELRALMRRRKSRANIANNIRRYQLSMASSRVNNIRRATGVASAEKWRKKRCFEGRRRKYYRSVA